MRMDEGGGMAGTLNTAMVLCAGLGTRMAPADNGHPKPLVSVRGKALLDHVLDRLAAAGITRAVINVHHKADLIELHLRDRTAPAIEFSDERDLLLGTGGGVKKALPLLLPGAFLIHNADSVWIEGVGSNLTRLAAAWDDRAMDCLLMLAAVSTSHGYHGRGDFALASDGRIHRRRAEQEMVPFAFAGVSVAHPRLFDDTPAGAFSLNRVWTRAIAAGRAFGMRMDGVWMHVGTPAALAEAEQCLSAARQP
jgi:N-acetyl-alpha-D-muramate 1-phosphate uridylyltransferase